MYEINISITVDNKHFLKHRIKTTRGKVCEPLHDDDGKCHCVVKTIFNYLYHLADEENIFPIGYPVGLMDGMHSSKFWEANTIYNVILDSDSRWKKVHGIMEIEITIQECTFICHACKTDQGFGGRCRNCGADCCLDHINLCTDPYNDGCDQGICITCWNRCNDFKSCERHPRDN